MNSRAMFLGRWSLKAIAAAALALASIGAWAAEPSKDAVPNASGGKSDSAAPAAALNQPLDKEQEKLAKQYGDLEKAMNRMAEVVGATDPKQAALLRQAFAGSRPRLVDG